MKPILDITNSNGFENGIFKRMLKSKYNKLIYLCDIGSCDNNKINYYKKTLLNIFDNDSIEASDLLLLTEYEGIPINIILFDRFKKLKRKDKTSTLTDISNMVLAGDKVILLDFLNSGYNVPAQLTYLNCKHMHSKHVMNMSNLIVFSDICFNSKCLNISKDKYNTLDYSDFEIEYGKQNTTRHIPSLKKERIVCAAIHYKDDNKYASSPKNIEKGFVACGLNHPNCKDTLTRIFDYPEDTIHGFITSHNRFLDSKEALPIAKQARQVKHKQSPLDILVNDDLY